MMDRDELSAKRKEGSNYLNHPVVPERTSKVDGVKIGQTRSHLLELFYFFSWRHNV